MIVTLALLFGANNFYPSFMLSMMWSKVGCFERRQLLLTKIFF